MMTRSTHLENGGSKPYTWLSPNGHADRYAAALKTEEDNAVALVLIFHATFRVKVPLALFAPRENNRIWVTLPNEVLPGEEVLKWILNPPNLQTMDTQELKELSDRVTEVATATRSIRTNLMTADDPTKDLQALISSIPLHIERSVEDILIGDDASIGLAVWEMHLAVEKSFKLLIRQYGGTPSNIHDLIRLSEVAVQVSGVTVDSTALAKLPSHREAIQARYGERRSFVVAGGHSELPNCFDHYRARHKSAQTTICNE